MSFRRLLLEVTAADRCRPPLSVLDSTCHRSGRPVKKPESPRLMF
ncbi:hypothetical protein FM125_11600 [Micrococcus lylae]|uniref:Uncharacterized protein n=1 Tax=Micrococcus lylae TaxID=1273 RepID=A0A1R4JYV6_9MICC|nr:hypothetical protein FM125_11600 [Micrococcus lylae]